MKTGDKNRLYLLADSETLDNVYYEENGTVKKQPFSAFDMTTNSPFIRRNPIGWKDEELSWETGDSYMLNRAFNLGLEFVYDSARIIRDRLYNHNGYEEEMYLVILKWDRESDVYRLEYKGKLDFSSAEDDIRRSIRINTTEGGILTYLSANKSTTYEVVSDETNPDAKLVLLDGMNLKETLNYSFIEMEADGDLFVTPCVFINNEGDHEQVLYGSPNSELVDGGNYFKNSSNYLVENISSTPVILAISGILKIKYVSTTNSTTGVYRLLGVISDNTTTQPNFNIVTHTVPTGAFSDKFSFQVTLNPQEKFFIYHFVAYNFPGSYNSAVYYTESDFKIEFISRKDATTSFCISLYDYYKQLVSKLTDGKYTGESFYLKNRTDLMVTCGDALRNTDKSVIKNYVIASSFDDFIQSVPGDLVRGSGIGLQNRNNVLYLELLIDLYNESGTIYDLGEVSDLKFLVAQDEICNTIQNGYPDQDYDTNGGKYEVNSEQQWQLPVLSNSKVFDIRSRWRADARGIEQIRAKYTRLDTTDNAGDKQPFIVQVGGLGNHQTYDGERTVSKDYTGYHYLDYNVFQNHNVATMEYDQTDQSLIIFTGSYNRANITFEIKLNNNSNSCFIILYKNGQSIGYITSSQTDGVQTIFFTVANVVLSNGDIFKVSINPLNPSDQDYTVVYAKLFFDFLIQPYLLLRLPYTSVTGVLDNTVYNVELRPRNQILAHGNELSAKLFQLQAKEITLNTSTKNTNLSTTLNGVTKTENAPIRISDLADALYLPYDASFTTRVPYNFTDLLTMSTAGVFTWTYEGFRFYGLPWGSMKSKPATSEAQEWKLRLSPQNLLNTMFQASYADLITLSTNSANMLASPLYSPLHKIKYNFTPQAKYHHVDVHEDWSYKRFQNWVKVPFYTQKWQKTDTIKDPVLSYGIGQLQMFVYDENGALYQTYQYSIITTQYVQQPFVLQECDIPLGLYDEGLYLFVTKTPDGTPVWISEWCEIKTNWKHTFLINYSHSENEKNVPWKAFNGYMELRVEAEFGQVEPSGEGADYQDDEADFSILESTPLQKRQLIIGHTGKVPEWMGLKVNAILLKDKVYIDGDVNDESKHYTRRVTAQLEPVRYAGMPYLSYSIEVIPATSRNMLVAENIPSGDINGWHATIDAQVFGNDTGTTEITILNQ